jgi:hypothetical protein
VEDITDTTHGCWQLKIFGLGGKASRHPLLEAWDGLGRRFAKITYRDHEAVFRALLDTELHVPTAKPGDPSDDASVAFLELESERGPAFPVCLDEANRLRLFPDSGSVTMLGAAVLRAARDLDYHVVAIFGDRPEEAELTLGWDMVEWLGVGLLPTYSRYSGEHAVLHAPGLVEACRAAVNDVAGTTEAAQLIEGVAVDGTSRAVLVMPQYGAYAPEPTTPEEWFGIRRAIEERVAASGHDVAVVWLPESFSEYGESTEEEFLNAEEPGVWLDDSPGQ